MKIMEERKLTFMVINFVTSFSDDGFGRYAEKMLLSVKEHWHPDLKLTAYYHDCDRRACVFLSSSK
jgi:hypothetical protein